MQAAATERADFAVRPIADGSPRRDNALKADVRSTLRLMKGTVCVTH